MAELTADQIALKEIFEGSQDKYAAETAARALSKSEAGLNLLKEWTEPNHQLVLYSSKIKQIIAEAEKPSDKVGAVSQHQANSHEVEQVGLD